MGWCFLVLFFSPAFWERGGVSVFIVPGWAGEQLVSIRCQLGWRLCQGWGGGGTQPQPLCVCQRGRQCPGRGDEDTGRVGVMGGGRNTHPLPSRLGGRAGGAPSCSDLSRATHAEPGRAVGHGDEGGAQHRHRSRGTHPAAPRGHLRPARLREEPHICKRGVRGEPPKKLKKKKKRK